MYVLAVSYPEWPACVILCRHGWSNHVRIQSSVMVFDVWFLFEFFCNYSVSHIEFWVAVNDARNINIFILAAALSNTLNQPCSRLLSFPQSFHACINYWHRQLSHITSLARLGWPVYAFNVSVWWIAFSKFYYIVFTVWETRGFCPTSYLSASFN